VILLSLAVAVSTDGLVPDCVVTEHIAEAVSDATVVILAVKPQVMPEVLRNLAPLLTKSPLVISVAAGITLARMAAALPAGTRLIRADAGYSGPDWSGCQCGSGW
jgi:pyrroline-5-carboxylate reductase